MKHHVNLVFLLHNTIMIDVSPQIKQINFVVIYMYCTLKIRKTINYYGTSPKTFLLASLWFTINTTSTKGE